MPELQIGRKSVWQKQFPTLLGILFLVAALGVGLFFFSGGLGDFAPRATPQTTPKNIKLTNVTDNSFTISFLTDDSTVGFVKYGTAVDAIKTQSSDDRDQLSGTVGEYNTHHITLRNLKPSTQYFYTLGTGTGSEFNNEGEPFTIMTAPSASSTSEAKTIYGNVTTSDGRPADGAIVYISASGMAELSTLVKSSGSWAVPLATARTTDLSSLAIVIDDSNLNITVQGTLATEVAEQSVTVATAQPVETLTLGQSGTSATTQSITADPMLDDTQLSGLEPTDEMMNLDDKLGSDSLSGDTILEQPASSNPNLTGGGLADLVNTTGESNEIADTTMAENTVIDLTQENSVLQTVTTTQPQISGVAVPNVLVTIEVHSENQITQEVVTDENGQFAFDLSELSTQLEPGPHTVTYSYIDPTTGETVTKTQNFTVAPSGSTLLAQANTTGPYGSGNPFPIPSPTPSPTLKPTPTPVATTSGTKTSTASATPSASTSTRSARPSTQSGIPVSGSAGTTLALLLGGVFFIFAGTWSYWVAQQVREKAE